MTEIVLQWDEKQIQCFNHQYRAYNGWMISIFEVVSNIKCTVSKKLTFHFRQTRIRLKHKLQHQSNKYLVILFDFINVGNSLGKNSINTQCQWSRWLVQNEYKYWVPLFITWAANYWTNDIISYQVIHDSWIKSEFVIYYVCPLQAR